MKQKNESVKYLGSKILINENVKEEITEKINNEGLTQEMEKA